MQLYHKKTNKKVKETNSPAYNFITEDYIDNSRIDDAIADAINILPFWREITLEDIKSFSRELYRIAFFDGFLKYHNIFDSDNNNITFDDLDEGYNENNEEEGVDKDGNPIIKYEIEVNNG